jgi:transposase
LASAIKKTLRAAEQDRPDIKVARALWRRECPTWDYRKLVFLDETGLNTKMARLYGRSMRGERCLGSVPHGHWKTATFIGALRYDRLSAPMLLDGPMNGIAFLAYIEQILCPELAPGDRVICDNLACHKVAGVRRAIESVGATLIYLPAYSPDLNPIELAFSKFKAALRAASCRTFKGLAAATRQTLNLFSRAECFHFFRHARYATN